MTYQLFPALSPAEYEALRNDIAERGVLVPVIKDEEGEIIDGYHRAKVASELGIDYPVDHQEGLSEAEKLELAFSLNIARRHLSGHDRTAVIADCRRRGMSLRSIAQVVGVSHVTVKNRLDAVNDLTPQYSAPEPPREPLPTAKTRLDAVTELREQGMTQREIADALSIDNGTVAKVLGGATHVASDAPVDWPVTHKVIQTLEEFAQGDARRLAASVPERNRRATAKRLRQVGRFLGTIAYELEGVSE